MMSANAAGDRADRFTRLETFLRQDPENPALLADACEAAIATGRHERATELIDVANRLGLDRAEWTFRRARLGIARRDLPGAERLLRDLALRSDGHPAIAHDLGYIHFLQGQFEAARSMVSPWLARDDVPSEHLDALQVLWLRSTHRLRRVQEGWDWARQQHAAKRLQPRALGVASLLAVDAEHLREAQEFADLALTTVPDQSEALVARASSALAENQTQFAFELLGRAAQSQPEDGRIWSTMAFASMQARDFAAAQAHFQAALASSMSEHVGSWHGLGWTRLLLGDRVGARAAFDRALELDRNFAESHGAIALMLYLDGQKEEAQHHLRAADKLDPRNVTGRFARAVGEGAIRSQADTIALAKQLLARPGFFGGTLADSVMEALKAR